MVDLSPMFPDYDQAEGQVDGDRVEVRLFSGGTFSTLVINVDRIQQALESIRIEQNAIRYAARMARVSADDSSTQT